MLNSDAHIIATVRSKQEYSIEKDEKTGRTAVKKLGMAPVQRDGMEYEFTVFMDIEQNHNAHVSKDRTAMFDNEVFMIDESTGERLIEWLHAGKEMPGKQTNKDVRLNTRKQKIVALIKKLGIEATTAEDYARVVKEKTGDELVPDNFQEITNKLEILVEEKKETKVEVKSAPAPTV